MTEFRKRYQSLPVDFHLWTQDKIAELWWKEALAWVLNGIEIDVSGLWVGIIKKELEE